MRSAFQKAFGLASFRFVGTALLALCVPGAAALAASNSITFSCADGYSGSICKAGGNTSCTSSDGNNVDVLNVTGVSAGSVITFSFTNTGNTSSADISLSGQGNSGNPSPSSLSFSTTASSSYTVTSTDGADGQSDFKLQNSTSPGMGKKGIASYTVSCTPGSTPSWTLTKTPNPTTYTAAGQTINYSYLLTNTGNVAISSITVQDDKISTVSCPVTSLAAGASTTCTGSYQTTANDVTTGTVTNHATAHGTPASGVLADATANATITFSATPSWTLTKTANPTTYIAAGQTINYSYVLTNTGNVAISSITVQDDKISTVSCPVTSLAAGASTTCTGSYQTTATDVTAGTVTNHATAHGTPASGTLADATAQATITFSSTPSWTLTKTANPTTYTAAGQTIAYSYVLTNTGNATISSITIQDDKISTVSCPATSLATGASMTCTGSYLTTASDVSTGSVTNHATAHGTPATGTLADATAHATITFKAQAALSITKSASPNTYSDAGQTITYTYVVTNTGNVQVSSIQVVDDKVPTVTCSSTSLSVGATTSCTGTYLTTSADVAKKSVTNIAYAKGKAGNTDVQSDSVSATVGLNATKTIETIHNFIERRVDLLASNEPDRARLMRRFDRPQEPTGSLKDDGGPMKLMGSSDAGMTQFSFATSLHQIMQSSAAAAQAKAQGTNPMRLGATGEAPFYAPATPLDIWVEGHFQKWEDNLAQADRSGGFGILYLGADYLIRPSILVGALVQLDWMDDHSKQQNTDVKGNGWMAGPYVSMKLSENIYFDARGAWGQSSNNVNPFGTYTDNFDTDRWLAKANFTGNWHVDQLRISPSVGVIYVRETQKSYVDSLGLAIPEQSAHVGRLTFGPEFGYEIKAHDGSIIEPQVALTGIWDFDGGASTTIDNVVTTQEPIRAKVEAGLMMHSAYGTAVRGTVSYDGIGTSDYHAWGGQLWVSLPLN